MKPNKANLQREEIIAGLKSGIATIEFEKSDGSIRKMDVTLHDDYVVPSEKKTMEKRKPNLEVVPVWSLKDAGWRSFRVDSLLSFKVTHVIPNV